ncbi:MAG: hypothetical protein ACFHVJ_11635 [Aestuariibacter sp.]
MPVSILPKENGIRTLIICLVVYAFLVMAFAVTYGYHISPEPEPEGYKAYFDKWNWFPYPIFFLVLGAIVQMTWEPFQRAWYRSAEVTPSVIVSKQGTPLSTAEAADIIRHINKLRVLAIIIAIALGFFWGVFDGAQTRTIYFSQSFAEQLQLANVAPDFTVKWIYSAPESPNDLAAQAPWHQIAFYMMLEIEQAFLIGLGFFVLLQVLLQATVFACLDKLNIVGKSFTPQLIYNSASRDFGLGAWNRAIDMFYWVISFGLVIAVISRFSQPSGDPDTGQVMGQWALGALLALPFLVTIAGRIRMIRKLDRYLEKHGSEEDWEARNNQNGWPMDPKRMQKVGFLICMALYTVFAGKDVATLVKSLIG